MLQHEIQKFRSNLWKTIEICTYLTENNRKIVFSYFFFLFSCSLAETHSRWWIFSLIQYLNILIAILADDREFLNKLAIRRTLSARTREQTALCGEVWKVCNTVRRFEIPAVNLGASEYIDMIFWHDLEVTEPPLTKH